MNGIENEQVVFYGAGEHARENFDRWKKSGLIPLCFCDKKQEMHGTTFDTLEGEAYPILSLIEVMARYPNFVLYLTQAESKLADVTEYLFGLGISKEHIRYCDGFLEPRYCKDFLTNNFINIESYLDGRTYYESCATVIWRKFMFLSTGDFQRDYEHLLAHNDELNTLLREGYYQRCYGCSSLEKIPEGGLLQPAVKTLINLSTGCIEDGDLCNQNCVYCGYPHIHREIHKQMVENLTNGKRYDLFKMLNYLESSFKPEDFKVGYYAGEIGMESMHNKEVLDIWLKNKWRGEIASNATVFLPGIAALLKNDLISLMTSIDCGSRQTYKRIKSVDLFDQVRDNLRTYAQTKGGILKIKYIFVAGINDNAEEIDKFLDLVSELSEYHPHVTVIISRDKGLSRKDMTENELIVFRCLMDKASKRGIKTSLARYSLSKRDIDQIYAEC